MNDPAALTLFERPPCGWGCVGCLVCRPQVALALEGAAAFAASGLVTVMPATALGVFRLAATEESFENSTIGRGTYPGLNAWCGAAGNR